MNKVKKINADITSYQVVDCLEENCPWEKVCANHCSAGDFRMEGGAVPSLHLRQGEVYCESYHSEGEDNGFEDYPKIVGPRRDFQDSVVLVKDLVEKTDDFEI